jgi:hypothetical protein
LATAALRGLLVVAALALGFFVLSKAFPSGDEPLATPSGTAGSPLPTVSPSPAESPTRDVQEPRDPGEIRVQVLNGTEVSGLASDTAETLEEAGYDIVTVADAESAYEVTTIFHTPKFRLDAQILRDNYFQTAVLEVADPDVKADITVNIGSDYVDSQDSGGTEASPEETPS